MRIINCFLILLLALGVPFACCRIKLKESCSYWDKDNKVLKEFHTFYFKENELGITESINHGEWKEWYKNGKLSSLYYYKDGLLDGEFKVWYPNGQLQCINIYKDGILDGVIKNWDENGNLLKEYEIKNGTGTCYYFYPDGKIKSEVNYKKGLADGIGKYYDSNGNIIKIIHYEKGQEIKKGKNRD